MRFSAGTSCSSSPTRGGFTGDRQAALDVVQESFIRAADHLVRLREDDKFGSSIFGIAHQRCVLHIRRARRTRELFDDESAGDEVDAAWLAENEHCALLRPSCRGRRSELVRT
jgi:DNA-directed RNA polymerase specialized sigma24 family protein